MDVETGGHKFQLKVKATLAKPWSRASIGKVNQHHTSPTNGLFWTSIYQDLPIFLFGTFIGFIIAVINVNILLEKVVSF